MYRFLARENCHFDAQPTEDAEKQRLQREHREHLRTPGGPIFYEFSTPEELRVLILSIDELRELVRPRRARIPFLPMHEKFTGRRQFLETLQQELLTRHSTTGDFNGIYPLRHIAEAAALTACRIVVVLA